MTIRGFVSLVWFVLFCLMAGPAAAQDFPSRSLRLIVPFSPGGGTDSAARQFAEQLQARLGQQVVVENRTGGGGGVGARAVAQARPDGYTLLFAGSGLTALKLLQPEAAVDVQKELMPVAKVVDSVGVLVTTTKLPVKTFPEFVAYVKVNPGKLAYGTAAGSLQVALEALVKQAGLDMVQVPYKGVTDSTTALLGDQVHLIISEPASQMGHREAGKVRFLALTSKEASPVFTDVPTTRDAGLGDWEYANWNGLMLPANTPRPVVERLARETRAIVTSEAYKEATLKWSKGSYQAAWVGPDDLAAVIARDVKRWGDLIEATRKQ